MRSLLALILLLPSAVLANTWSFTFPAEYCRSQANNPALITIDSRGIKNSFAFEDTTTNPIYCDIAYPRGVTSNALTVNLTWNLYAAGSAPTNVCWSAAWMVNQDDSVWESNFAAFAPTAVATPAPPPATTAGDATSTVTVSPVNRARVACDATTNPCGGFHGILKISRNLVACPPTTGDRVYLSRIEIQGTVP